MACDIKEDLINILIIVFVQIISSFIVVKRNNAVLTKSFKRMESSEIEGRNDKLASQLHAMVTTLFDQQFRSNLPVKNPESPKRHRRNSPSNKKSNRKRDISTSKREISESKEKITEEDGISEQFESQEDIRGTVGSIRGGEEENELGESKSGRRNVTDWQRIWKEKYW